MHPLYIDHGCDSGAHAGLSGSRLSALNSYALHFHYAPAPQVWRFQPSFFVHAVLAARQARAAAGNLSVSVLREGGKVFWTRTLWDSESSMSSYLLAGAHHRVMPRLLEWCDEAAVAHWIQESPQPPDWPDSHRQLVTIGRPSKVRHPSEAQRQYQIPAPQVLRGKELRWK